MSVLLHKIVFTGEPVDGFEIAEVRRNAERRLGMSPRELDLVFSGRRVVLKRGLSEEEAARFIYELAKLGMRVVMRPQEQPAAARSAVQPASLKAQLIAQDAEDVMAPRRGGLFGFFSRRSAFSN